MKVLHLSKFYYPYRGGIEQVVQDICEGVNGSDTALDPIDFKCDVICITDNQKSSIEQYNGVTVYSCPINGSFSSFYFSAKYLFWVRSIVKSYDILHLHLPNPLAGFAIMLANLKGKKIVLHWHSDIVKQKLLHFFYSPFEKWLLRVSSVVIATSPNYIGQSKCLQSVKDKVVTVPIGLSSPPSFSSHTCDELRRQYPDKKIIFSLGRHVYYKGFEYLIQASKGLPDDYVVLIGGSGPLTSQYEAMISSLKLESKVILIGRVDEALLGSYFAMADVFCLPSVERSEAFGVVQIESLSVGTPIVSCNIPGSGVSWVNQDGVTGRVVAPRDIKSLTTALVDVVNHRDVYISGAKVRFDEVFTAKKMNSILVKLYRDLMDA
ncbi:glycosyltransferase [Aeromonas veronii]|uniref:glycosyltransferase n=1 Tax=Aeromonas veronii TaxID=654 RepID=UPI003F746205